MTEKCKHCGSEELECVGKYSDVIEFEGHYYDVHLTICKDCFRPHDDGTWVE